MRGSTFAPLPAGGPAPRIEGVRLVVLDDVLASIGDRTAAELFAEMVRLRAGAYAAFYPKPFVPFDRSDFIATHYLVCADEGGTLRADGGYKRVPLDRCDAYGVEFPAYGWIRRSEDRRHALALDALVDEHRRSGRELAFNGGLALRPRDRARSSPQLLRELAAALAWEHHQETGGTEVTAAVLRARTDVWFRELGYVPLAWDGDELPAVTHTDAPEDQCVTMVLREPSAWARDCHERHAALLAARLRIGGA
jgi:hypothetical protein